MSGSLQEQLLKAGLVDPKRLESEKKAKHRKKKQKQARGPSPSGDDSARRAEKARREKIERDRKTNSERDRQRELRAVRAQVREIVEQHRIDRDAGETPYQFVDRGKIKKIYVLETMPSALAAGTLAIIRLDGRYDVVPAAVANRIVDRDPRSVVVLNDGSGSDQDDAGEYAEHPIPDDLVW